MSIYYPQEGHEGNWYRKVVCPTCGKVFHVRNLEEWTYKRTFRKKNHVRAAHVFCRYRCMVEWDREHPKGEKKIFEKMGYVI